MVQSTDPTTKVQKRVNSTAQVQIASRQNRVREPSQAVPEPRIAVSWARKDRLLGTAGCDCMIADNHSGGTYPQVP